MNDDHAISVYAIAKKACENKNSKLSNAKMKSISLSGYKISFVLCKDDVCEMKNVMIPFNPPLKSQNEARYGKVETNGLFDEQMVVEHF